MLLVAETIVLTGVLYECVQYVKAHTAKHIHEQNIEKKICYLRMFFVILHDPSLQLMVLIWYKFVCRQVCVVRIILHNIISTFSCTNQIHLI